MPCIEISIPKLEADKKSRLAAKLTEVFSATAKFPGDILGVRFFEYEPGQAAQGGRLWDGKGAPYLHILIYCPRLKRSVKQKVVENMTAAFCECVGNPAWKPVIHICEHPYDNVGVDGKLLSDAYEECAKREFYYLLPKD